MTTITSQELTGQLLTVNEVAQSLKVPVSWVYERTRRQGSERMPHMKLGKDLRFELANVRTWLATMRESMAASFLKAIFDLWRERRSTRLYHGRAPTTLRG